MESAKIKLETVLVTTAVVFLSDPIFLKLFAFLKLPRWESLGFTRIAQTVLVLAVVAAIEKNFRSVGLSGKHFLKDMKQGIIWSASFGVVAAIAFGIIKLFGYPPFLIFKTRLPALVHGKLLFFIVGGLIAPFAEEVFFRGVIFGYVRKWGFPFALFMSTAVFVAFHILFSGTRLPITQIVGGLVFAVSYEIEKSLWVPVIIHMAGNLALFSLSLL
jgi:membrane protease YdiL (CAAX protease family)